MDCCDDIPPKNAQTHPAPHSSHHSHTDHNTEDHQSHGTDHAGHEGMITDFKKRLLVSALLSVPILALSPLLQRFIGIEFVAFEGQIYVVALLASIIFFYGGKPFLAGSRQEVSAKTPGMMTLIGVAISVAYIYSLAVTVGLKGEVFFWELATLIDVMLLGHWIEMRSVLGASKALDELTKLLPANAHRLNHDGSTTDVAISELHSGDTVMIKPGEKVPADGVVIEGETYVNESLVTGESKPVARTLGQEVIGGSVNQDGAITITVKHVGSESYLARIADMVSKAQASQSRTQTLASRVAFWLTLIAIGGGLLTFLIWMILGKSVDFALSRMVTVMVITCPHALGLAIPLVVARSTTLGARSGILIKNRIGFEAARNIDTIVLDKTGTLTTGQFEVAKITPIGSLTKKMILSFAASVEAKSQHPLAASIVRYHKGSPHAVDGFKSLPGIGVEGRINGHTIKVVSPRFLRTEKLIAAINPQDGAQTHVYVIVDTVPEGIISLQDSLRPDSKEAVRLLKQRGIRPVMLTGDNTAAAQLIATKLGISSVLAEVLPDDKQAVIAGLIHGGNNVAMVGDGVNDAPALATAHTGIAIGSGTDVAAETADVILVKSSPKDIPRVIDLSRATYAKMKQNLWWASGYNIIAIPLAAGVLFPIGILLSPAVGAALMSVSTIVVALNARRLKI